MRLRVGSLCTGYGGLEMGLRLAGVDVDLRWLAEIDAGLDVLHPAGVPNLGDLTLIDWADVESVDLVTAGFPCQPFSAAGAQLAEADPRYLWPQVARCLEALRPRAVLLENVRNLPSMRKGEVWANILADLGKAGYAVRWLTLGACAVGAAHHRHRVFALGVQQDYETDEVTRLDVQQCGARRGLLPTVTARDGDGRGTGDAGYWDRREATGRTNGFPLDATVALLPTPRSRDHKGPETEASRAARVERGSAHEGHDLSTALALLPTPRASDHEFGGRQLAPDGRTPGGYGPDLIDLATSQLLPTPTVGDQIVNAVGERSERGVGNLRTVAALLPTPRASDGVNGGPGQRGSSGDLAMPSAVQPEHWGRFADAVARHEAAYGPAPAPTEPNRNGAPRLRAQFAEWLMCIPAGHVTDALDRRAALKAVGNGVCPPQAAAAWRLLTAIDTSLGQPVASPDMTTTTNQQIREIQDRDAQARGRVIAAAGTAYAIGDDDIARAIEAAMMELAAVWRESAAWWLASGKRGAKGTAAELTQAAGRLAGFAVGLSTRPVEFRTEDPLSGEPLPPEAIVPEPLSTSNVHPFGCECGMAGCNASIPAGPLTQEAIDAGLAAIQAEQQKNCEHPEDTLSTLKSGAVKCTACGTTLSAGMQPMLITKLDADGQPVGDPILTTTSGVEFTSPSGSFEDRVAAELAAIKAEQTQHLEAVTAFIAADATPTPESIMQHIIDNPFTSPHVPGVTRAPVATLPYDVLPVIAQQLEPRTQLSHSFVETYERCSLQSMLERASRHGLVGPRRPSWSLIGGNAFHACVEAIERDAVAFPGRVPISSRSFGPHMVDQTFVIEVDNVWTAALDAALAEVLEPLSGTAYADTNTWHASQGGKEGYDWWRVEGALMLHRYLEFHDAAWRSTRTMLRLLPLEGVAPVPVIEHEFVASIAADAGSGTSALTTKGFIDAVWLTPGERTLARGDTLDIVDWKTGSRRPTSTFQLGEYAHGLLPLLPAHLSVATIRGSYWLARKGEYTPAVALLDRHSAAEMTYRYRQAALGSSLGIATPNVTDMCVACGVRDYCPAQAGR